MISLLLFFSLLSLLSTTHAVDVTISPAPLPSPDASPNLPNPGLIPFITQHCPGIPPGVCCIPRPLAANAATYPDKRITFRGLEALDIAATWAPHEGKTACDGKVQASHAGGGTWQYDIPTDQTDLIIAAGSYMRMPAGNPQESDVGWMQGEGVLGFVTGEGDWWSKDVNKAKALNMAAQYGFGSMAGKGLFPWSRKVKRFGKRAVDLGKKEMGPNGVEKRGIRSANRGWVLCQGPRKGVYPDVIEVDGVAYKAEMPQAPVYVSGDGKVMNYTEPAS